ncbi:MAG: carboxylating nicotinate-nucleotide diphosphorylase [Candidatus Bathyarchaeota archaeon]|nr:MAG: carboxylating nicotinate-nucleotide diphosphorylase [Candidatus Bathyarchaeota archaeon]
MMFLPGGILEEKIQGFLEEDIGQGDVTTLLTIPHGIIVEAEVVAEEEGIVAGIEEVSTFLRDLGFKVDIRASNGSKVEKGTIAMRIVGDARTLLSTERTILNLVTRMSGIATKTRRVIKKVRDAGYKTIIACTRKVAPGLLYFDKKAVMLGGGDTHRLHMDDLILIKDNHLAIIGDVSEAVKRAGKVASFSKKIEIEVSSEKEALDAVEAGANIIMLDNFSPKKIRNTISLLIEKGLRDKVFVEVSGGINEFNVVEFAATEVDILSLGEITASTKALDMSLDIIKVMEE